MFVLGSPCDANGILLPPDSPSPLRPSQSPNDWGPYGSKLQFETAELIFKNAELSAGKIDTLCDLWARSLGEGVNPPFTNHRELYETIDATPLGDIPWRSFKLKYTGEQPADRAPSWMNEIYEFWFRDPHSLVANILSNPDFNGQIDYSPYRDFLENDGTRRYEHFMSGDWAWTQAVSILPSVCHFLVQLCV